MSNDELNILTIDSTIQKTFEEEIKKLPEYKKKIKEIQNTLELENLYPRIKILLKKSLEELLENVNDIENHISFNFYIIETAVLLEKYKSILNTPMKINFMGKPIKNNTEKQNVISAYLDIAQKYIDIDIEIPEKKYRIVCENCNNKKEFDIIDNNIYICLECSAQQIELKLVSSYKDIDRVNTSSKYMYDRKVHFRDSINQYQGKQNSTIPQKVYDDLEEQFCNHHLISKDKSISKEKRFACITKKHIEMFLTELGYTKHYENIILIHYNFTGIKPDDISYLEDKLLDDFDTLTDLYDKIFSHIDRKNFINTQYVLFQLLRRHKHPCEKEDFAVLKTVDRKSFHDDICSICFAQLGWNHVPFF
jgi:hypothetical protein